MKHRKLGPDLEVSALGLGCMPMARMSTRNCWARRSAGGASGW